MGETVTLGNIPILYPSGEEDFDWAEAKAQYDEECRAETENLREGKINNSGKEKPPLNFHDCPETHSEIEGGSYPTNGDRNDHRSYEKDSGEVSEVEGELPPLVEEGPTVMVCINYELRQTRFALKDYLTWIDEDKGPLLHQFFHHYDKYPVGSKAVKNFIAAMDKRPKRLDRMSLRNLVGLRAEVYVETVKPEYSLGALKGQPMPESMHYSKVAEIIRPLGRVDLDTLIQLRKRC